MKEDICQMIYLIRSWYTKYIKRLIQLNIKKTKTWLKIDREHELTLFSIRRTDGQQSYEKMLNITDHQANANQNQLEIPPHSYQNGYPQKGKKQVLEGIWEKRALVSCWGKCKSGNTMTLVFSSLCLLSFNFTSWYIFSIDFKCRQHQHQDSNDAEQHFPKCVVQIVNSHYVKKG